MMFLLDNSPKEVMEDEIDSTIEEEIMVSELQMQVSIFRVGLTEKLKKNKDTSFQREM